MVVVAQPAARRAAAPAGVLAGTQLEGVVELKGGGVLPAPLRVRVEANLAWPLALRHQLADLRLGEPAGAVAVGHPELALCLLGRRRRGLKLRRGLLVERVRGRVLRGRATSWWRHER